MLGRQYHTQSHTRHEGTPEYIEQVFQEDLLRKSDTLPSQGAGKHGGKTLPILVEGVCLGHHI